MKFIFYLRDKTVAGTFTNKIVLGEPIKPEGNILELYDTVNKKSIGHFDLNFRTGAPICCNENFVCVPSLTEVDGVFYWNTYILDAKDLSVISIIEDCCIKDLTKNEFAFFENQGNFDIYNLSELVLCWKYPTQFNVSISENNFIYSYGIYDNQKKVICFNIKNGDILWTSQELNKLINNEVNVQMRKNVFLHKVTLWLALQDGSCILLDALTGDFIKHIINPNPVANAVSGYYHSAKLNRMVKLHNNHFHEIDMDTHEVRYWDIQDIPKGMVKAADDTHIYMLDWKRPIFYAFNIEIRCIDFEWEVPDDIKVQMTSPLISVKLSEDFVFVGTLNSEFLFVFDKENGKIV